MSSITFVGAGASVPFGIPAMAEMALRFEQQLTNNRSPDLDLYKGIKYELRDYQVFDIEALITVLQDIIRGEPIQALNQPSVHYFSDRSHSFEVMIRNQREACKRNRAAAESLLTQVKRFVMDSCVTKAHPFEIYEEFFYEVLARDDFLAAKRDPPSLPTNIRYEIFTTNYDPVLEAFFKQKELPYECGQTDGERVDISSRNTKFYSDSGYRIFKLHGSFNWYWDRHGRMQWLTGPAIPGAQTALGDDIIRELQIYPAHGKYTFREPFHDMFQMLKQCLMRSATCYIVGYSFRDEDILGLFHDSLDMSDRLRLYIIDPRADKIKGEKFANYPNRIEIVPMGFSVESVKQLTSRRETMNL